KFEYSEFDTFKQFWFAVNTRCISINSDTNKICLAPLFDCLNHDISSPNTKFEFNSKSGLTVYNHSKKSILKNEQVFISYGAHDNYFLLLEYGFIVSGKINKFNVVYLDEEFNETCLLKFKNFFKFNEKLCLTKFKQFLEILNLSGLKGDMVIHHNNGDSNTVKNLEIPFRTENSILLLLIFLNDDEKEFHSNLNLWKAALKGISLKPKNLISLNERFKKEIQIIFFEILKNLKNEYNLNLANLRNNIQNFSDNDKYSLFCVETVLVQSLDIIDSFFFFEKKIMI
ncbi:hypothetical protein HDU92_006700, partial [Lobulomyces angularis]